MGQTVTFWKRIRRTPYQSVASIFMIFITLFVMAIFLLLVTSSSAILSYFESKPQLTVFFKDEKDMESVTELIEKLKKTGKIASTQYISKEQALAIYKEQNKNDPILLEMVTADILPASLEISATMPVYLSGLAELVNEEKGIDEVVFQKDVVDTLISWTSTVRKVGFVFIFFLLLSTLFILLTTIGMKIALRKEEIEVLRLVGATFWFIRKPFISEGLIYGITGATLAWVAVSGLLLYLRPFITSFLQGIPSLPLWQVESIAIYMWPLTPILFVGLWLILVFLGFIIGLIGSLFAVSRYLKD